MNLKFVRLLVVVSFLGLLSDVGGAAQQHQTGSNREQPVNAEPEALVQKEPRAISLSRELGEARLIKFSGAARDSADKPHTGTVGITFALYAEQEGGAALWVETQNVEGDAEGRYTVLLGAETKDGLPLEIFSSTEARWLGVQVQGEEEQARILLVSVPYALKAADAERLGGQPASTYASLDSTTGKLQASGETLTTSALVSGGETPLQVTSSGTVGRIARFTCSTELGDSELFDDGVGRIGIGTVVPTQKLEVAGNLLSAVSPSEGALFFGNPAHGVRRVGGTNNVEVFTTLGDLVLSANGPGSSQVVVNGSGEIFSAMGQTTGAVFFGSAAHGMRRVGGTNNVELFTAFGDLALSANGAGSNHLVVKSSGNVGIGTTSPTAKLEVAGQIKITGGSPGAGKVLTSDATGFATWATPPSGTVTSIAAGTGISASPGSPITSSGTLSLDTTFTNSLYARLGTVNTFTQLNTFSGGVTASTLSVDSPTLVVDAVNNRVGIARGVPDASLHVGSGPTDGRIRLGSAEFLEDAADLAFTINASPNSFLAFRLFADADSEIGLPTLPANLTVHGNLQVNGALKNAIVPLADGRRVALYSMESPQSWFEDFGGGQLRNGVAVVTLEPTFALTVNTDIECHVFLTPNGDCRGLYVAQKTPRSFEVRELGGGRSGVRFDYRIVARRLGFESLRLEEFEEVVEAREEETAEAAQVRRRRAETNRASRRQRTTLRPVSLRPER